MSVATAAPPAEADRQRRSVIRGITVIGRIGRVDRITRVISGIRSVDDRQRGGVLRCRRRIRGRCVVVTLRVARSGSSYGRDRDLTLRLGCADYWYVGVGRIGRVITVRHVVTSA